MDTSDVDEEVEDAEFELTASYKAHVKSRTLSIIGNNADSSLALGLGATATILEVDVGDDGSTEFRFDRSTFERIRIDAAGGKDIVTIREVSAAFTTEEQVTINGGSGDDTIHGGAGAETINAGAGNDLVVGRYGIDRVSLGAGDDTYVWDPGGGSDVVEGDDGVDVLLMRGSNVGEQIELSASEDRLRLTRDVAAIALDLHALEVVDFAALGGSDTITIRDLAAAGVDRVDVDLSSSVAGQGDALPDAIIIDGTAASETIDVWREGVAVTVAGLATEVSITGGEVAFDRLNIAAEGNDIVNINGSAETDLMTVYADPSGSLYDGGGFTVLVAPGALAEVTVHGLGGDDTIATSGGVVTPLILDGGDGDDQIFGGYAADLLLGGAGNDVVDGQPGADRVFLGEGDDTFIWDPGDSSDVLEGEGGADALVFNASNASDALDLRANGSRVSLYRNIASTTTDVDGVERIDVTARGGADTIVVNPLTGTAVAQVDIDLAAYPGSADGDTQPDTIAVAGTVGSDVVDVAAEGNAVAATGLGATVSVVNGEPALDRMVVHGGVLNVNGSPGADTMVANADASGAGLYDGGGFNVLVAPSGVSQVTVFGHGGDDWIGTSGGVTVPLILDGGEGDDRLVGGYGADLLRGGAGNDIVDGQPGADTVLLGEGDDTYLWDPGDSSDVIDGELGADALIFNASGAGESIEIRANGSRAALYRNIASTTTDLGGIERIDVRARGGSDAIVVRDVTGTPVTQVNVDLAAYDGSQTGDAQPDSVAVLGSAGDDSIAVTADAGGIVVSGLAAAVRIAYPEVIDQLAVYGQGGIDAFMVQPGLEGLITLTTYQD